jgi:hypothetical protein
VRAAQPPSPHAPNAHTESAELVHGVLLQYFLAAFSLRRRLDEGLTELGRALVVDWGKCS